MPVKDRQIIHFGRIMRRCLGLGWLVHAADRWRETNVKHFLVVKVVGQGAASLRLMDHDIWRKEAHKVNAMLLWMARRR
jgi:hypothetical protein